MGENAVRLKLDIVFKKTFSEYDELLHGLLADLLKKPYDSIKNIKIRNSEILPDSLTGKFVRMDLNVEADGELINVEMQYRLDANFKDRALFHWSKLYGGELKSGEDYGDLKPSICINIVNHNIFDCEEYHSCFRVLEENRLEMLSDKCAIHFFELKKIGKDIDKDDKTKLWLQLINAESEEEFAMLEQTGVAPIQKAVRVIREMSEDVKMQEIARMREKALHDEATALNGARREGEAIGLTKGRAEGRAEGNRETAKIIARNALRMGMNTDAVIQLTGLTREEIKTLGD
jgi:predicted transposase/invertase (TIGR01784 family)